MTLYSWDFSGGNNHMAYIDNDDLGINSFPFTYVAWIKQTTSSSTDRAIAELGQYNVYYPRYLLDHDGTTDLISNTSRYQSTDVWVTGETTITNDTWYHVAGVFGGNSGADKIIYVNGSEDATDNEAASFNTVSDAFCIGNRLYTRDRGFCGKIHGVAVWTKELTPSQIASLANGSKSPLDIESGNLVGYWPGEYYTVGATDYLEDYSGNDHDLEIIGATQSSDVPTTLTESTNLLSGKVYIRRSTTKLVDGKVSIKDLSTKLLDGKLFIENKKIVLLDGKVTTKDKSTKLLDGKVTTLIGQDLFLDGKIFISYNDIDILDGYVHVINKDADLLDGTIYINVVLDTLFDGKLNVIYNSYYLLDGKVIITIPPDTDLLDGVVILKKKTTKGLDGKLLCAYVSSASLDGSIRLCDVLDNNFDSKLRLLSKSNNMLDGYIIIPSVSTNVLDGVIQLPRYGFVDGKINVKDISIVNLSGSVSVKDIAIPLLDGTVWVTDWFYARPFDGKVRIGSFIHGMAIIEVIANV